MRLRSQSLPLEQTGEEGCEQWQQSALEKEGGRRGCTLFHPLLVQSVTLSGQASQVSGEVYESFPYNFI